MMRVWIVAGEYGNSQELDGYEIVGVYDNEDDAVAARDAVETGTAAGFHSTAMHVRTVESGAAPVTTG